MNCYEAIDVMGDAVEGHLDPVYRSGFDEHMAECRPCRTYFEQLGLTRQALRRLAQRTPQTSSTDLQDRYRTHFRGNPDSEESS